MTQERRQLRFKESAQRALDFLLDRGFELVEFSIRNVRYESEHVYIEMFHGFRDYEVSITFGRLAANETIYFSAFLELANPAREKSLGSRIADTHEAIAKAADGLAKALQSEGELIITGNDELYDLMKQVRFWHFHPEYLREDHPDYRPKDQR